MARNLKVSIINSQNPKKRKIARILKKYNIKKVSSQTVISTIQTAHKEITHKLNDLDSLYAVQCFDSGYYYDNSKKRWNSQSPLKKEDVRKVIDFINTVILLAPKLQCFRSALPTLETLNDNLYVKRLARKQPCLNPRIAWQRMVRHIMAKLCSYLIKNVHSSQEIHTKLNLNLTPAAQATCEILALYGLKLKEKAIKDAYHS